MRADRLISILMLLQTKGRMTAHDLAEQLEVSERTIYRDVEALSTAGIPLYTERGPGGGCALVDGYQTRLTGLTEAEVQALFLLNIAGPLADLGLSRALDNAMLKLTAALPMPSREYAELVRQRFHIDATWWYHTADASSCLQVLQEALWQDRKLLLFYHEDDGAWSERLAEPYGLVSKAGAWYLVASCHNEKCVFRVTRIHRAVINNESFIRPGDFDLASYWTDYCVYRETKHPEYAPSLRLAPDEVERLPQLLHDCGYMLVENHEAAKVDVQAVPVQRHQPKKEDFSSTFVQTQQKKEIMPYVIKRHHPKMGSQRKKGFRLSKKTRQALQKKTILRQHIKKTLYFPLPQSSLSTRSTV